MRGISMQSINADDDYRFSIIPFLQRAMKANENVTCSYQVYASKLAIFSTFPDVQFA